MERAEVESLLGDMRRSGRDTLRVEAKRARGGMPMTLQETISAFANGDGGVVLLGVDERTAFSVTGIDEPGPMLDRVVTLCRSMDPPLGPAVDAVEVEGATVIVVEIAAIPRDQRPCHFAGKPPWDSSFVRMADGDLKLTSYEVQLLLENRSPSRHDQRTVPGATLADLDRRSLDGFVRRVREQRPVLAGRSDEEIVRLLNVVSEETGGVVPTLAGLLAFGSYPQQHLPQLNITLVVYPTPTAGVSGPRGERFLDNRSIDGPIPVIVRDTIAALKRHMKQRSVVTGLGRVDEWEYPEEVLREVLVNSLVHRDYSAAAQGTQVQVELFPDRLVVRNPGGLFGPLHVADLGIGTVPASSRNPVLLKILEDTPLDPGRTVCENRGSGIVRMRTALTEAGMEPPTFDDQIAHFEVTFPNHALLDESTQSWLSRLDLTGLGRTQISALALARRGDVLTNISYRSATGVADSRTATAQLQELRRRGYLIQDGSRGQASYRVAPQALAVGPATLPMGSIAERVYMSLTPIPQTRHELAEASGVTDRQAIAALRSLRSAGRAELIGLARSRNARWRQQS